MVTFFFAYHYTSIFYLYTATPGMQMVSGVRFAHAMRALRFAAVSMCLVVWRAFFLSVLMIFS